MRYKEILSLYNDDDASFFSFLDGDCGFYAKVIASKIGLSADISKAILRDMRNRGLVVFSPIVDADSGCPSGGGYFLTSKGKRAVMEAAQPAPKFKPLEWVELGEMYKANLPIIGSLIVSYLGEGWHVELSASGYADVFYQPLTVRQTAQNRRRGGVAEAHD